MPPQRGIKGVHHQARLTFFFLSEAEMSVKSYSYGSAGPFFGEIMYDQDRHRTLILRLRGRAFWES